MYLSLPSGITIESSDTNRFDPFLSLLSAFAFSLGNRLVGLLSTRSRPISLLFLSLLSLPGWLSHLAALRLATTLTLESKAQSAKTLAMTPPPLKVIRKGKLVSHQQTAHPPLPQHSIVSTSKPLPRTHYTPLSSRKAFTPSNPYYPLKMKTQCSFSTTETQT